MRAVDVIADKRDGRELSDDQIRWFVYGCVDGTVTDYQAAAWLMAVFLRGMSRRETVDLTVAMADSGTKLDLGLLAARSVDKHSTGGVGDKISLVAGPIAAAAGVVVPKMSGRGLGITGGTLDKLEAIPGMRVDLSADEILHQASTVGLVITGQTADLAPADARLYALRDVTATTGSLPLIVSSVLSKKLAGGAPSIVLDVKAGSGAFMQTVEEATELAQALVETGAACGRHVVAYVTRMDEPLGWAVGNALEVREAIDVLKGRGPADVHVVGRTLATEMILAARLAPTHVEARRLADLALSSGAAAEKLKGAIEAQGGEPRVVDDPSLLRRAPIVVTVKAPRGGYLAGLDAGTVGRATIALGAGRARKGDAVDHRVGVVCHRKVGDLVKPGDNLFTLHLATDAAVASATESMLGAYAWSDDRVEPEPRIIRRLASE